MLSPSATVRVQMVNHASRESKPPSGAESRQSTRRTALAAVGFVASFGLLALVLGLTYGRMGYHPTDQGLILGLAWRVYSGEVPFADFFSLRLPGSLYLHALWNFLPDPFELRATRIFFYAQNLSFVAIPLMWLGTRQRVKPLQLIAAALLALGFSFFAMNNFPNMPWYTLDGIFFCVLGLVAFVHGIGGGRPYWLAVAGAAFAFAALCKQNFAAAAAVFWITNMGCALFGGAEARGSLRAIGLATAGMLIPPVLVGAHLALAGALGSLVEQIGAASEFSKLLGAGVAPFTSAPAVAFGLIGVGYGVITWKGRISDDAHRRERLRLGSIGLLIALAIALLLGAETHDEAKQRGVLAWMVVLGFTLTGYAILKGRASEFRSLDALVLLQNALLLAIGWSAAISWSVVTPMLAVAPLALHNPWLFSGSLPKGLQRALVLGAVVVFALGLRFFDDLNRTEPYREHPYAELTVDLGEVFPKLSGIYSTRFTRDRFADLKQVIDTEANAGALPFVVLRDYPAIHYLTGTQNPIGADWLLAQEVRPFGAQLISQLDGAAPVAILDRTLATQVRAIGATSSPRSCAASPWQRFGGITHHIATSWDLKRQTEFFCIYRKP